MIYADSRYHSRKYTIGSELAHSGTGTVTHSGQNYLLLFIKTLKYVHRKRLGIIYNVKLKSINPNKYEITFLKGQ